ncbi:Histone transcription regulator 3 [Actinomortierella ambigua]|uniref:Histone transcription regulator 3 n=1 Tax=Actinomortierella ambigua TaxID=1343610 RepID=A0A9P6QMM0_9FUNG|nr:Histone transcription regulator 3 [Actinomortierella ambigua]
MFKNMIDSELLQKIDHDSELAARGSPVRLLLYLVYSNYASILEVHDDDSGAALHYYLKAVAFDNMDGALWTKIGVLYEIGDFAACSEYVGRALQISPYFHRGIELQQIIHQKFSQNNLGELLFRTYKALTENDKETFWSRQLRITFKALEDEPSSTSDVEMDATPDVEPTQLLVEQEDSNGAVPLPSDDTAAAEQIVPDGDSAQQAVADEAGNESGKERGDSEPTGGLKRKRREIEERPSLRSSKRVRDKLDQFEETKRKREEEEQEVLAKYKLALALFGLDLEQAFVKSTGQDVYATPHDIFPQGISPFLTMLTTHLERPQQLIMASTMDQIQSKQKTNHFAIFSFKKQDDREQGVSLSDDKDSILAFIERTNGSNSGVIDYLCEYVMQVMTGSKGICWQQPWTHSLRPLVYDIILAIEGHLTEFLQHEMDDGDTIASPEQQQRSEFLVGVCELLLDEIVTHTVKPIHASTRRIRGAKKPEPVNMTDLESRFRRWVHITNQYLGSAPVLLTAETAISQASQATRVLVFSKYDTAIDADLLQERLERVKLHQYVLDAERLFSEGDYNGVLTRLEPFFLHGSGTFSSDPATVEGTTETLARTGSTIGGSLSERLELMEILYKSCQALGLREKQFSCAALMFTTVTEQLVNEAPEKSEGAEIWFLTNQVTQMLVLLRESLQDYNLRQLLNSIDGAKLQRLVCCVLAVARSTFVNILHQDRIVDEDIKVAFSDLLKGRPQLELFNTLTVRAWLVLLLLLPGWYQAAATESTGEDGSLTLAEEVADPDKTSGDATKAETSGIATVEPLDTIIKHRIELELDTIEKSLLLQPLTTNSSTPLAHYTTPSPELYMELVALVHDDLGVREMCGIDNSQLIQLALKISSPMEGAFYRKEENQCYYCFYGIALNVDGQYPIEHSSKPVDFDRKAAIEFYPMLERSLLDRSAKGPVRSDVKDALDRVEEALGSPPFESNAVLAMNRNLIDDYLASEINFAEVIQVNRKHGGHLLPTMKQPPSSKLEPVFKTFYFLQGRMYLAQFNNKAKNNQFKPIEDLQHAIDQFRTNIFVNPDCWESWYALANCYASLADENLVFSASDIRNNFEKIKDLQRKAFLCFSYAAKIAPAKPDRTTEGPSHNKSDDGGGSGGGATAYEDEVEEEVDEEGSRSRAVSPAQTNGTASAPSENRDHEMGEVVASAVKKDDGEDAAAGTLAAADEESMELSDFRHSQQQSNDSSKDQASSSLSATVATPTATTKSRYVKKSLFSIFHKDQDWHQRQAEFWFDFGNLVFGIMSRPMRMEAVRRSTGIEVLNEMTGDASTVPIPEPTETQMYKFALFCFQRSMKLKLDNWRAPMMLGRCLEKLGGPPRQILALYKCASELVPHRTGQPGNEKIVDPVYKIISALGKYLSKGKIKPSMVISIMTRDKLNLSLIDSSDTFTFEAPEVQHTIFENVNASQESEQKSEKLEAYRLLCEGLARIRHADRRRWQHRPVYRQACILYHIFHDVERAKAEILSLFQIKSNAKTLVSSVWKPEFERCGKHFVYVGGYTRFLIQLCKETKDVETLNTLARKVRKASGLLLDHKDVWELLYDAYLSVLAEQVGTEPTLAVADMIPRMEFREKAALYEARFLEQEPKPARLVVLQRLVELKKLNEKAVPDGSIAELMANCYSKLFIEFGGWELYPRDLLRQLTPLQVAQLPMEARASLEAAAAAAAAATTTGWNRSVSPAPMGATEDPADMDVDGGAGAARLGGDTQRQTSSGSRAPSPSVDGEEALAAVTLPSRMAAATSTSTDAEAIPATDGEGEEESTRRPSVPSIVVDLEGVVGGEEGVDAGVTALEGATMDLDDVNSHHITSRPMDKPTTLAPGQTPSVGDAASREEDRGALSGMETEGVDRDDWKGRKKISLSELASRAATICKVPPPSLKAPAPLHVRMGRSANGDAATNTTAAASTTTATAAATATPATTTGANGSGDGSGPAADETTKDSQRPIRAEQAKESEMAATEEPKNSSEGDEGTKGDAGKSGEAVEPTQEQVAMTMDEDVPTAEVEAGGNADEEAAKSQMDDDDSDDSRGQSGPTVDGGEGESDLKEGVKALEATEGNEDQQTRMRAEDEPEQAAVPPREMKATRSSSRRSSRQD